MRRLLMFCLGCLVVSILVGCARVEDRGEIVSLKMTDNTTFLMMVKYPNTEVKPRSFSYRHGSTNVHIYADVKEGEMMWYEGTLVENLGYYERLNVHIRPDYNIKLTLEKKDE